MEKKLIIEMLYILEKEINIKFPSLYVRFLSEEVQDKEPYELITEKEEYIYIYNIYNIQERNDVYSIQNIEPNYFLIGQNGDIGYFIYVKKNNESDNIYSLDLGALGSLEMNKEATDIYHLGKYIE
ncbi:SMI1/KNR4 family protein [Gilliamella sp. ESL0250]|uniref:SMI1/KNR4 family protein n=1 Tax=Gilliamella sp. ESL0250 TaxID=2705036 RepID=UPI001580962D|nr:SMI1/KNR4 family protein [Gilliamella sp. ESL0250]NUF50235.1 SMI1/KNR4 family protein [Gilliamella sp. ESL0250]